MNFYLGLWNSPMAISDDEAAARYRALSDEKSVEPEFDDQVYTFYSRLTSKYPEIEMVPEDELDACPWASGLDVAGDHVIMAIQLEQAPKIIGHIVALAAQLDLVYFDPQADKVYLPPRLEKKRAASTTGLGCASEPQPAAMQVNDDLKAGGGDEPCLRAEK
jgi:hypothetical protein